MTRISRIRERTRLAARFAGLAETIFFNAQHTKTFGIRKTGTLGKDFKREDRGNHGFH
jgi:hypothetical protein